MKRIVNDRLLKLIFNPLVIALPFALITILLLPGYQKIRIVTESYQPADKIRKNTIQYYTDLNNDSIADIISHFETDIGQCAIKVQQNQDLYRGQWNFNGKLPREARSLGLIDYNFDGILDLFVFYQRADSLFIGGVDIMVDSAMLVEDIFIDRIKVVNDTTDFTAHFYTYDLNNDNIDELIFTVNAGYSEVPRRIYAWDIVSGKITKSPLVGFRNSYLEFADLDGDGYPEIIPSTVSYENIEKGLGIPYNDYERWFVIYDHDLQFKFGPVKMGSGSGSVRKFVIRKDDGPEVYIQDINNETREKESYYKFNTETGRPEKTGPFYINNKNAIYKLLNITGRQYLASYSPKNGRLVLLNGAEQFSVITDEFILQKMSLMDAFEVGDSTNYYLVFNDYSGDENFLRFANLNHPDEMVGYPYPKSMEIRHISVYTSSENEKLIAVQLNEHIASLKIEKDIYYLLKTILTWILIYGFYVGLIWLILRLQRNILQKHYQREQLIAELKLKSIRNQLDPHFTFNAVNAIASAIYKEEKDVAYNYFSLFSKLLRSTTLYSDRMTRSLKEELEFTRQYLDIELFRYRDKFEYNIEVDDDVNVNIEVPRMIIQTFAESSVTNGLMHRSKDGRLNVRVKNNTKALEVVFVDNGVGIRESKRLNKTRAFKSLRIMDEFIRIFNELNRTNITYKMHDIEPGEKFPGTRVIVNLPFVHRYKGHEGMLS